MSIICQTFVQNAWRSDLCSNCFKSFDDHSESTGMIRGDKMTTPQRYVPQAANLYQSRGISSTMKWRLSEPLYDRVAKRDFASQTPPKTDQNIKQSEKSEGKGILIKSSDRKLRSRSSVDFASEEALVIGYGGNDYDSDLSPWEMGSDDGSIDFDLLDDNEEDRKITKLTKNNTEFNSSNQNLLKTENTETRHQKEVEKQHKNNNNNNNNNTKNSSKSPDKSLNITYNNIQNEKKLNQYYFPSSTEKIESYLNQTSNNVKERTCKSNKEQSKDVKKCTVNSSKCDITSVNDENCKNLLHEDFTPLNTRTYCFVSELNKSKSVSEHSSDSDYSTCRLTAGDSTDSESFQDADESRMEPCPSFLHGNYPKNVSHSTLRAMDCDKKYDEGSSTSGDVSNLSDDSDSHDSTEKSTFKLKVSRCSKSSESESKKFSKEIVISSPQHESQASSCAQNSPVKYKEISQGVCISSKAKESHPSNTTEGIQKDTSSTIKSNAIKNSDDVISIKVNSQNVPLSQKEENNNGSEKTSFVADSKNKNSLTTNGNVKEYVTAKVRSVSSEYKIIQLKESSSNLHSCITDDGKVRNSPKSKFPNNPDILNESERDGNINESSEKIQNESTTDREQWNNTEGTDYESSPDTIAHRQSKLAALALELELARRDSARPNSVNIPVPNQTTPPQVKTACGPLTPNSGYPPQHSTPSRKNAVASCTPRLTHLPDILQETPVKTKKSRFSLKKLLKRNSKDNSVTPADKESNPKAWKKQSFDRSRLSLEIVHPMDLNGDHTTSGESTPTEEGQYAISKHPGKGLFKGGYSRARSLSALPQIAVDSNEQSNCSLLDCRKVETLPSRKAGTVAERKKNRPSLVRTPSCSALPNRSQPSTPSTDNTDRSPPPKPPPPPKYKVMHPPPPPPPPHHLRNSKALANSPARPPPPKILEAKCRSQNKCDSSNMDKEYANLGDIRSQLMPKKPQRPSAVSVARENETESKRDDDHYEILQVAEEEEDHYTYLDDAEMRIHKRINALTNESAPGHKTNGVQSPCSRPWLELQTSYSAIAATNYESLAEIISSSINESPNYFKNAAKSMKFKDFILEMESAQVILENRLVFNAIYKNHDQDKIMLMIIQRKSNNPSSRNQTRYPVLASFSDYIPKSRGIPLQNAEYASVYLLQRSSISTLFEFAENTCAEEGNQYIHLRNYCFLLLQLIHTLKSLQAEGIEDVNFDLNHLILVTTQEDKPPIFVLFPEDKIYLTFCDTIQTRKTLCQAILSTMFHFLRIESMNELKTCLVNGELLAEPVADTFSAIAKVLLEEKASSLTQAKGFLEYMLWGPVDVKVSDSQEDDVIDPILQRWLDLQRAQMVKSTISQLQLRGNPSSNLHVFEEYQLIFLLQASVKSLKSVISKL